MKRLTCTALLLTIAVSAAAAEAGKATGRLMVGNASRKLTHAYAIEKKGLVRIVLSSTALQDEELFEHAKLQEAVRARKVSAVVVQLDEERFLDSSFFFDAKLPAGLEVRQVGWLDNEPSPSEGTIAGSVKMKDDGYSFSYEATFEAKVTKQPQVVEPLAADASPADHAIWRLKQKEIPFDEAHYRSAVMDGDADTVKLFLVAGMPVETSAALRQAVDGGKTEVVKLLLEHGANKDGKDEYGQSLVMTASSNHHVAVLEHLIAAGADVNVANQYRITPLAVAAEQGHLDIVKLLIAAGARINARDTAGGTALSVAILRGYQEIVATLLAAGADVQRDKDDLLELAKDKPEIKAMLLKAMKGTAKK